MKLVNLGKIIAVSAAVAVGGMAFTSAEASSVGFAGIWSESSVGAAPATTTLSFGNLSTLFADGDFTGYSATAVQSLDLILTGSSVIGDATVSTYAIDTTSFDGIGWKTYSNGIDSITFDLAIDSTWVRTFDGLDGDINFAQGTNSAGVYEYFGVYNLPASLGGGTSLGRGQMNASATDAALVFQITQATTGPNFPVAPVPLPAAAWLLASAIGAMGVSRRLKTRKLS